MEITVNGVKELGENISILEFLKKKQLDLETVIVEHNFNIVKKEKWKEVIINAGDEIEVLSFVGGG